VANTNLSVIRNRPLDAERLQAFADYSRRFGRVCNTALDCERRTYDISPACIFKANRLNPFYEIVYVDSLILADFSCLFNGRNPVFF